MPRKIDEKYFAFIPKTTTHSKQLNSLAATARWLYVVLVSERHGVDFPFESTYVELHKVTGFSTATISKGIKELEKAGFLTYEHGGLRNPNLYDLEDSWLHLDRK